MAVRCHGNGADHCCYVDGHACRFLEVGSIPGRHWVCGLRRELGSWAAVHADPRYVEYVRPSWDRCGVADCGDWKIVGQCCFGHDNPPVF